MKQAILVMGNGSYDILQQTVNILDDIDIDFYIYIYKRNKKPNIKSNYSKINFVSGDYKIKWGTFYELLAEKQLIDSSVNSDYEYFHFISSGDFPLMNKNYFKKYFSTKPIKLGFVEFLTNRDKLMIRQYYPIQSIGFDKTFISFIYVKFVTLFSYLFHIERENYTSLKKGFPFFSLPKEYVLQIAKYNDFSSFEKTIDSKKYFVQTVLKDLDSQKNFEDNTIYSNDYIMMRTAKKASRLVNYLRTNQLNWFYAPSYEYNQNDFDELKSLLNLDYAFVHSIKSGSNPSIIFDSTNNGRQKQ
jgi:hypothetical protein